MSVEIISTAFPYGNSAAHFGNISSILKTDLFYRLKKAFYKNNYTSVEPYFFFSFHATGLPIYVRLKRYQTILKPLILQYQKQTTITNRKLIINDLKKIIRGDNLEQLRPHFKNIFEFTGLKGWMKVIRRYYGSLFKDLKILCNSPLEAHTTTSIDKNYSFFVNQIYEKLHQKGLLIQKDNYVISCDSCKNVIGDHDRTNWQGIGIYQTKVKITTNKECVFYSKGSFETNVSATKVYKLKDQEIYLSTEIKSFLDRYRIKQETWILYEPLLKKLIKEKDLVLTSKVLPKDFEQESSLYYTIDGIKCRCKGTGTISFQKTMFVKTSQSEWKEKALKLLENSNQTEELKIIVKKKILTLRDIAFLRNKGYGTTLDLLKNDLNYKNLVVDSLMDATLHYYYYACVLKENYTLDAINDENFKFSLYTVGKDLVQTHIINFLMFTALLLPDVEFPYVEYSRFIVAKNNEKMSKSANNVVTWHQLKQQTTSTGLRCFLSSLADNTEPSPCDMELIKKEEKIGIKHHEQILSLLRSNHLNDYNIREVQLLLDQIVKNISYGSTEPKMYQLRKCYYLIFNDLRNLLKNAPASLETKEFKETQLIKDLLGCFMVD